MIIFLCVRLRTLRLAWPMTMLVLLLQRTPVLRMILNAGAGPGTGAAGQFLRAMIPAAFAIGATHTLTGQTRWITNPTSPVSGTVGTPLTVVFAFTGNSATPESYSIVGTLPSGLSVTGATGIAGNLTLNSSAGGTITGTPTASGAFTVTLTAFDSPNRGLGTHGSSPLFNLTFNIVSPNAPPSFTTHPVTQSVAYRGSVTLTVAATGTPTPTLQWRKDGANISGQTGTSLALTNVDLTAAGSYTCVATNVVNSATSNAATITVTSPAAPTISTQPIPITSKTGSGAFFSIVATGVEVAYQWRKGGVDIAGATQSSLFISSVAAGSAGNYSVHVTNPGGSVDSNAVALTVVTSGRVRLINLSARAMVGTGDNVLIPGFFVGGSGSKNVLIRAVGPKLADFGVTTGFLADPVMQLFRGPTASEQNDDWTAVANQTLLETTRAAVSAFPLTPSSQPQKDASLVVSLDAGGTPYTVKTQGVGNTTGVALVELFDADAADAPAQFINISARAQVGTGGNVLIPGFFIEGDVAMTLLIRGVGPRLATTPFNVSGALEDPVMTLFRISNVPKPGDQEVMTTNDNWEQTSDLAAFNAITAAKTGFALTPGAADSALLVSLNPGGYTVKIEGKNNTTGVALMEIYLVGP